MNKEEAIVELQQIARDREQVIANIKRKKSWAPSEKAMAIVKHQRYQEALNIAIDIIKESQRYG